MCFFSDASSLTPSHSLWQLTCFVFTFALCLNSLSQGINDRIALGGARAMSTYFLRYYGLHYKLWERGLGDYNHLWAEPFLAATVLNHTGRYNISVLREPLVLNYTEQPEIPRLAVYVGGDNA